MNDITNELATLGALNLPQIHAAAILNVVTHSFVHRFATPTASPTFGFGRRRPHPCPESDEVFGR